VVQVLFKSNESHCLSSANKKNLTRALPKTLLTFNYLLSRVFAHITSNAESPISKRTVGTSMGTPASQIVRHPQGQLHCYLGERIRDDFFGIVRLVRFNEQNSVRIVAG
jgi:hypothetical protein